MPLVKRVKTAFKARAKTASLTVTHTDLTDADAQQDFDFAAALPTGAVVIASYIDVTIAFTDGAAGTATADLGVSGADTDALIDGADISTAIAVLNGPKGVASDGLYGGDTLALRVDGSVNLDTFTAGSATATAIYLTPDAGTTF